MRYLFKGSENMKTWSNLLAKRTATLTRKYKFERNIGGFLYGGTRKLTYFLNGTRKNCIYFGGLQKTEFQFYEH